MMSPRPPPPPLPPQPPPLSHFRQLLTPDRSEPASSPSQGQFRSQIPAVIPNSLVGAGKTQSIPPLSTAQPISSFMSPPHIRQGYYSSSSYPIQQSQISAQSYISDDTRTLHGDSISSRPRGRYFHPPPPPPPPVYTTALQRPSLDGDHTTTVYSESADNSVSPSVRRSSSASLLASPDYTTTKKRKFKEPSPEDSRFTDGPMFTRNAQSTDLMTVGQLKEAPDQIGLRVRQQPVAARACGFGERDRRVIDPPPIVQLVATGTSGESSEVKYPFNVVHCTLWNVTGESDETALINPDKRLTRRLMGTLVSSPFVGVDENGIEGCFFSFPDLSCRTHGKYRLKFVLLRLDPMEVKPNGFVPVTTEIMSDVFTVYSAKEFPGMRPSTALTKSLKRQGCAISVKKGNEKTGRSSNKDDDEKSGEEEEESDQESANRGTSKRRKKA